ncbi:MAG TPA: hypothetical protein VHY79_06205 [Rhizomicrobium sp.]|jgi:hypothetical protein|nr:hypothetical protein [Rhizomicrobium sp.]
MNEHDLPEPPARGQLNPDGPVQDEAWCKAQLEILRSDPSALDRLRNNPGGCAVLKRLAEYSEGVDDRNLAITWLAVTFPGEPMLRTFLFDRLRREERLGRLAPLYGILAHYAENDSAVRELAAFFRDLTTGETAYLLLDCFHYNPHRGVHRTNDPPPGVSEQAWEDYRFAITSAQLRLLPNPDLQDLLFDIMRRDPDGPVELALEEILRAWVGRTP